MSASYALFVTLGLLAAAAVRRIEVRRLGYDHSPGHTFVGLFALAGAALGAKFGMILFVGPEALRSLGLAALTFDFTGKTVVGGIAGGYLGVELGKRLVGVKHSTGDAFAVALPLAQAFGRVGCWFNGCCFGVPTSLPMGRLAAGTHPTQLYEAALDLGLAAAIWSIRQQPRPAGHLFRLTLIGYACIRFAMEPIRGDQGWLLGPLTAVQWVCLGAIVGFGLSLRRSPPLPTS
ncbi:hypothetical protein LBMAG42_25920 [Deltaproteobacteria bacterium]|nr:hypothetical protein LBMAG42_25920 [Deltaproteobacteria bacterium]